MCESCGCGQPEAGKNMSVHEHEHEHIHNHDKKVDLGFDLLEENRKLAAKNRELFRKKKIVTVNILGSPGAGKTSLLSKTLDELKDNFRIGIITGDLTGDEDMKRLARKKVVVHQIQTGRVCHLDAHMIAHALEHFSLDELDILFIENVGNLVCPAAFDLGETKRVFVLSIAEGADKPSKYPEIFSGADAVLLSKIDFAPYTDFDFSRAETDIHRIRFTVELMRVSSRTGDGIKSWCDWLARLTK